MNRRRAIAAGVAFGLAPLVLPAQPRRLPRVGVVYPFSQASIDAGQAPSKVPFEQGLRDYGWIDGKNVEILVRPGVDADGRGRIASVIQELVDMPVDVLVPFGGATEAQRATSSIPIVVQLVGAVKEGAVKSLATPGGNVTGVSVESHGSLATKRLGLLKEAAGVKRVARFYFQEGLRFGALSEMLPEYAEAARNLGLEVFPVWALTPAEIESAYAEIARRGRAGLSIGATARLPGFESTFDAHLESLHRHRLPAIYDAPISVEHGGLMSYGDDIRERARRLAYFVDRILRGAQPSELPVEQPSKYPLWLNLGAAKAISLRFPESVLLQADRVFD